MKSSKQYAIALVAAFAVAAAVYALKPGHNPDTKQTASAPADEGSSSDSGRQEPADFAEHDHGDPEKQRRMGIYHFNEGNKFLREGDWGEAVRNYKMALHHDPEKPEFYVNLSTAYLRIKDYDQARQTLETLRGKNPDNPMLFYNLACYYALTTQTGPGLETLQKAVALGFEDFQEIKTDPDLANLRKDPKFAEWIQTVSSNSGRGLR
ncbi:MAG: tetratricopeptide repeat protein [Nitrospinales bacterium]